MQVNLKELYVEEFLEYAKKRMARGFKDGHLYNYVNENRLRLIFEWMQKKNIYCQGPHYRIVLNGEVQCHYINPETERRDYMVENLYHEVWCKAEWACRGLYGEYRDVVEDYFSKTFCKQLAAV